MSQHLLDTLARFHGLIMLADGGEDIIDSICGRRGERSEVPKAIREWVAQVLIARERHPKLPDPGDLATLVVDAWSGASSVKMSDVLTRLGEIVQAIFTLANEPFKDESDAVRRFLLLYELYEIDRRHAGAGLLRNSLAQMFDVDLRRMEQWISWADERGLVKWGRASDRQGSHMLMITTAATDWVEERLAEWRRAAVAERAAPSSASGRGSAAGVSGGENMIKLFISHSAKDAALAKAFVDCVEQCVVAPDHAIRCTSVPGYKLEAGDVSDERLRDDLEHCSVVVGILTEASLQSGYVMMELGAAWAFRKVTCALLAPGLGYERMPGPTSRLHGIKADSDHDIAQLMQTLSTKTGWPLRNAAKVTAAVNALVAAARATQD